METKDFFEKNNEKDIKKLTDVGFTREQAIAIIEIAKNKALSGGFF